MDTHRRVEKTAQTAAVIDVLSGRNTVEEVARALEVDANEVELWKSMYLTGARDAVRFSRPSILRRIKQRPWSVTASVTLALLAVIGSKEVLSQAASCVSSNELCAFTANSPARASEVNHNFELLHTSTSANAVSIGENADWIRGIEGKIGEASEDNIVLIEDADIENADRIVGFNDLRLSGSADPERDDLVIGADGNVTVHGNLSVEGSIFGGGVVKNVAACCQSSSSGDCCASNWGYTRVAVDLNQGAGGDYCYLCYQK